MSTAIVPPSDHGIQAAVQDELEWTPDVDAAGIGVAVDDGVVRLSGQVDDYVEQLAAKRAALRVRGVTTVVDDLIVRPQSSGETTEADIAKAVTHALRWASNVPDSVRAEVRGHCVTLAGEVRWNFEREAARRAVQYLHGVHDVKNAITLLPRPAAPETQELIKKALVRNALIEADNIAVTIRGNTAILAGHVGSWAEKKQAGAAAWSSPHVTDVVNDIVVRPPASRTIGYPPR